MRKRVLAACLCVLVMAGCSPSVDSPGVASVNGSGAPSAPAGLSFEEQGREHARCMRENGIPEADPRVQPNGAVRVGGGYDKSEVDGDVLSRAIAACQRYEPVLTGADGVTKADGAREYARCMRAHGVADFPDPDADGRFVLPAEVTDPDYDQATAACREQPRSPEPAPGVTGS